MAKQSAMQKEVVNDSINLMPRNSGFTLIELIITITIVGVLSSFVLISYPAQQKRARDSKKKTEIKQFQIALENYANRNNGAYPSQPTAGDICNKSGDLNIPVCPTGHTYQTSGTSSYTLWFQLETNSKYFLVCSNGVTIESTSTACP